MSYTAVVELFASLVAQVTLLIGIAAFVSRRRRLGVEADRCWAITHLGILVVTFAAFFGPHLRVTTWAAMHPGMNYPANGATLALLGRICIWFWPAGAIVVVLVAIAGMFKATFLVR